MFQEKERSPIIVHSADAKSCAEYLQGLISEMKDAGVPINAVVHDAKTFAKFPTDNKPATQRIIYIGEFSESKSAGRNITNWELNQFGISYGWHGSRAVIKFDKAPLSESDFNDMVAYAEAVSKGNSLNMMPESAGASGDKFAVITKSVDKRGFNPLQQLKELPQQYKELPRQLKELSPIKKIAFSVGALFAPVATGMAAIAEMAYNKKDELDPAQIKEQQMRFAVLHFCLYRLMDFMGIKGDSEN